MCTDRELEEQWAALSKLKRDPDHGKKSILFLAVLVLLTLIAMATLSSGVGMLERWFNGPAQVEAREE